MEILRLPTEGSHLRIYVASGEQRNPEWPTEAGSNLTWAMRISIWRLNLERAPFFALKKAAKSRGHTQVFYCEKSKTASVIWRRVRMGVLFTWMNLGRSEGVGTSS